MSGKWWSALACTILLSSAVSWDRLVTERQKYWAPIINDIGKRAGIPPMRYVKVMPLKGCGYSFGETITSETTVDKHNFKVVICRSRHGVRADITTTESRWIRRWEPKP